MLRVRRSYWKKMPENAKHLHCFTAWKGVLAPSACFALSVSIFNTPVICKYYSKLDFKISFEKCNFSSPFLLASCLRRQQSTSNNLGGNSIRFHFAWRNKIDPNIAFITVFNLRFLWLEKAIILEKLTCKQFHPICPIFFIVNVQGLHFFLKNGTKFVKLQQNC